MDLCQVDDDNDADEDPDEEEPPEASFFPFFFSFLAAHGAGSRPSAFASRRSLNIAFCFAINFIVTGCLVFRGRVSKLTLRGSEDEEDEGRRRLEDAGPARTEAARRAIERVVTLQVRWVIVVE